MTTETPIPANVAAYTSEMRKELTESRLGHLGRRIEMLVNDAHESIASYGSKSYVAKLAGQEVSVPVETTITISVIIQAGGASKSYSATVGASPSPPGPVPRPEVPLGNFGKTVAVAV